MSILKISRRQFLMSALLATGSASLAVTLEPRSGAKAQSVLSGSSDDLSMISKGMFQSILNTSFQVSAPKGRTVSLTLTEVLDREIDLKLEQFILVFRGAARAQLKQGTYWFEHGQLGRLPMFLVPMKHNEPSSYYQVAFNRLRWQV